MVEPPHPGRLFAYFYSGLFLWLKIYFPNLEAVAPLAEYVPGVPEALYSIPRSTWLGMVVHAYNPSTQEMEAGGSEFQGHPCPHSNFEAILGYIPQFKKNIYTPQQLKNLNGS